MYVVDTVELPRTLVLPTMSIEVTLTGWAHR